MDDRDVGIKMTGGVVLRYVEDILIPATKSIHFAARRNRITFPVEN